MKTVSYCFSMGVKLLKWRAKLVYFSIQATVFEKYPGFSKEACIKGWYWGLSVLQEFVCCKARHKHLPDEANPHDCPVQQSFLDRAG